MTDGAHEELIPRLDGNWDAIVAAAEASGRFAARGLIRRCSKWDLASTGTVDVRVGPREHPVVSWLLRTRRAQAADDGTALIEVRLAGEDLPRMAAADRKARSLLVREAYAAAYCTVLSEETGAVVRRYVVPDRGKTLFEQIPPVEVSEDAAITEGRRECRTRPSR